MTNTNQMEYIAPQVELIETHIEKGFAGSNLTNIDGLTDYIPQESQTSKFN